jgi:hypothetical protein
VRDFTLASRTSIELQELQRSFVSTIFSDYDAIEGARSRSIQTIKTYTTTNLTSHFQASFSAPFHTDELAKAAFLHDTDAIVDQAIQSANITDIENLAEWLSSNKKDSKNNWSAACLYEAIANKYRGLSLKDTFAYLQKCLSALKNVPSRQSGKDEMKSMALSRSMRFAPARAAKEEAIDQILAWMRDEDEPSPAKLLLTVACILCGFYPSQYCVHRDVKQLREAAVFQNCSVIKYVAAAQKLGGYPKFYTLLAALCVARLINTCCAISKEWNVLSSQVLGSDGQILMEISDMYTSNFCNYHERMMTGSKWDPAHGIGFASSVFLVKFGGIRTAQAQQAKWEGIDVEVKAIGTETPSLAAYLTWPFLEVGCLERVCQVWGVDWANAASWATHLASCALAYTYTDEEGCCVKLLEQASIQVICF